jgi:beta-xylosidase
MSRRLAGAIAATAALTVAVAPALTSSAFAASTGHSSRVITTDFPDPGFAKFGTYYYLYKTGGSNIGVSRSTRPQSGYAKPTVALANGGSWVSKTSPKIWAPDVFQVADGVGKPLWVMYYTAVKAGTSIHCIGVATSRSPLKGFQALSDKQHPPICADTNDGKHEAIDPAMYRAPDGKRYLVYKTDVGNAYDFRIRARQMDPATGTVSVSAARTIISTPDTGSYNSRRIEAPSLVTHGGKVWLFASRANYADCSYYTQAYSASSIFGRYTSVRTVLSQSTTGLCGTGGATVYQDGATTRVAFHAWKNGTPSSKVRVAWVGVLGWNAGGPYLH